MRSQVILEKSNRLNYLSALAVLISFGMLIFQFYNMLLGDHKIVIASSPSSASIILDGKTIGKTPLAYKLKRGSYTLGAQKDGFETSIHAIYVSEKAKENIYNLVLTSKNQEIQKTSSEETNPKANTNNENFHQLFKDIEKIKSMILLHPEESVSIPIIHENLRLKNEEIKALRDEIKEIKEQYKWFFGSIIAIIVGLLGVIASLFVANKK